MSKDFVMTVFLFDICNICFSMMFLLNIQYDIMLFTRTCVSSQTYQKAGLFTLIVPYNK